MGIKVNRVGKNYADNIIDPLLSFDTSQTWTTTGTGSAVLDPNTFNTGVSSLKIINTDPTNDLVVSNSSQNTTIAVDGNYRHSFYLSKSEVDEFLTLEIETFVGLNPFNTQTYVLGSETTELDVNDKFVRFVSDVDYNLTKGNEVSFVLTLKGKAGTSLINTTIWVDSMMLEKVSTDNFMPSTYKNPVNTIKRLEEGSVLTVGNNQGVFWISDASGTTDGTAYERGDLLYTSNSNGVQKTKLIADFSA